jgi:hypothetical protein
MMGLVAEKTVKQLPWLKDLARRVMQARTPAVAAGETPRA